VLCAGGVADRLPRLRAYLRSSASLLTTTTAVAAAAALDELQVGPSCLSPPAAGLPSCLAF
jgi:hypothetical protein